MGRTGNRNQGAKSSGREAAPRLAGHVDRAGSAATPPTPEDAAAAWTIVEAERAELATTGTRWQRLRARIRPTSFVARTRSLRLRGFGARPMLGTLGWTGSLDDRKKGNS